MTILGSIGNGVDKIVGVFSPRNALERKFFRDSLNKAKARSLQYAAAKTNRLTGPWSPLNADINTFIKNSSSAVRARVRQLVRDFPYFVRAVNVMCDYTVGPGIIFQSRIKDEKEKLNKKLIQKVEDSFNFWADEADISGKLHYYEMMELAKRQDLESGEFLIKPLCAPCYCTKIFSTLSSGYRRLRKSKESFKQSNQLWRTSPILFR